MKRKISAISLLFVLLAAGSVKAQFSGYGSVTYGYNGNPLYNYQQLPDNLKQTYLEMSYSKETDGSLLKFSYVSGLILFSDFSDRNYYEHTLSAKYGFLMNSARPATSAEPARKGEENNEDEVAVQNEETSGEEVTSDSTSASMEVYAAVTARHDKDVFKEFDNNGGRVLASYKTVFSDYFNLRVTNDLSIRNYSYIKELSNLTDILTLQISNKYNGSYSFGVNLSAAYKYYLSDAYDTTKFETSKSWTVKPGKGKGGASIKVPSSKQILLDPMSAGSGQYTASFFFRKNLESALLETALLYRYNPATSTRYLAQQSKSGLNEDIYNDYFSYQGPEAAAKFSSPFLLGTNLSAGIQLAQRNFEAPAYNLNAEQTADHRTDKNIYCEVFISKPLGFFTSFPVELSAGAGYVRNQSNDDYNDYSGTSYSIGIGVGF